MDEIREMEALRAAARGLRHDPDEAMLERVRTGVRARIAVPASPWDVLAGWLRPAAISLGAIVVLVVAALALAPAATSEDDIAAMTGAMIVEKEARLVVP